jgi:hypothetical protein
MNPLVTQPALETLYVASVHVTFLPFHYCILVCASWSDLAKRGEENTLGHQHMEICTKHNVNVGYAFTSKAKTNFTKPKDVYPEITMLSGAYSSIPH